VQVQRATHRIFYTCNIRAEEGAVVDILAARAGDSLAVEAARGAVEPAALVPQAEVVAVAVADQLAAAAEMHRLR
jgi:hypothetical protein